MMCGDEKNVRSRKRELVNLAGHVVYVILYLSLLLLAVLFHNSKNMHGMLYAGYFILFPGLFLLFASVKSRKRAGKDGKLIETGIYGYVRHPGYLGHMLIILSLVLIAQCWPAVFASFVLIALLLLAIKEEERRNREKFGAEYENYMRHVPAINILAGIFRQISRRKGE